MRPSTSLGMSDARDSKQPHIALAGVAAVVVDARGERRAEAHGRAVIAQGRDRAMTADTPVRVASISKLVTTLGVMRLVEAGKLDLDRDVSNYLGWRLRNPAYPDTPITLRLLLSHRSTLIDAGGYFWPLGARLRDSLHAENCAPAAPGAYFSYANINYGVVAEVMEAATGERFDRLMTDQVFAPLRLDACYNWSGCSAGALTHAAAIYRKGADETHWQPTGPWVAQVDDLRGVAPPCPVRLTTPGAGCDLAAYRPGDNGTLFSPQGGVRISARGLGRIARLLLGEGSIDGVRFLNPETIRAMMTPAWRDGATRAGETYAGLMRCWGLSLECEGGDQPGAAPPGPQPRWWGHLGDAYGAWTGLWVDVERRRGYAFILNGTADDPETSKGTRTRFHGFEEAILADLVR